MQHVRVFAMAGATAVIAAAVLTGTADAARAATFTGPPTSDPFSITDASPNAKAEPLLTWTDLRTRASGTYPGTAHAYSPTVSADGSTIAFIDADSDDGDLDVLGTQTGTITTLVAGQTTIDTATEAGEPAFSPAGTTIAYVFETYDENANTETDDLYTVPVGGGTPTLVASDADNPVYTPAGTLLWDPEDSATCALDSASGCYLTDQAVDAATGVSDSEVFVSPTAGATVVGIDVYEPGGSDGYIELGTLNLTSKAIALLPGTKIEDAGFEEEDPTVDPTGTELYYLYDYPESSRGPASLKSVDLATGTHIANVADNQNYHSLDVHGPTPVLPTASLYTPLAAPLRLLDTRTTTGGHQGQIAAAAPFDLQVTGGDIPSSATAVVLNVAGTKPTATTDLRIYPTPASGTARPTVSNLNLVKGQTAANAVTVTLGTGGKVRIADADGATDVVVDAVGYYSPLPAPDARASDTASDATQSSFTPLATPSRVLDTRVGTGAPKAAVSGHGYVDLDLTSALPSTKTVTAVVLNVVGTAGTAPTFLSAYPSSAPTPPTTSTVNLAKGETRANLATVAIGSDDVVRIYNASGSEQVVADLVGYYTADETGDAFYPTSPTRIFDTRDGTKTSGGVASTVAGKSFSDAQALGSITTAYGQTFVPASATALQVNLTAVSATQLTFLSLFATPAGSQATPTFSTLNVPKTAATPNAAITAIGAGGQVRVYNSAGKTAAIIDLAGWFAPLAA